MRAIDVAPAAVAATRANAVRNGLDPHRITADATPIGELEGCYDLVVANVLAPALIEMAADLRRLAASTLIVSGLIDGRYDHVVDALAPLHVVDVHTIDGWAAVTLQHSPGAEGWAARQMR